MNAAVPLIGAFTGALLICFPGWGLKQILSSRGIAWRDDAASSLLVSFALGVHLNAIVFMVCWVFVAAEQVRPILAAVIALNLAIGMIGLWLREEIGPPDHRLWVLAGIGLIGGEFAANQFPNVLDSVQILQVQKYILGWEGGHATLPSAFARFHHFLLGGLTIPTQPGFAGLTLVPSLLQPDLPVVTVASGLKVLLLCLAAVVSDLVAREFGLRARLLAALLNLANLTFSQFGLNGLMEEGKDSIFAVLMVVASITSVASAKADAHEPGLFLSAAFLLGAVAVPYGIVFWLVFTVASGGNNLRLVFRVAAWCLYPVTIAVVGVRATAANATGTPGLLPTFLAGLVALWLVRTATQRIDTTNWAGFRQRLQLLALLPAILVAAIVAMLPARAGIVEGYEGSEPVVAFMAPLDGLTTAFDYFLKVYPVNNVVISVIALLACVCVPLACERFRTPFHIALFSFLPATTVIALVNLHLHLHLLTDFNVWDITKDTVQWYVGAFAVLMALVGIDAVGSRLSRRVQALLVPTLLIAFLTGLSFNYPNFVYPINLPRTATSTGAYWDEGAAKAMDDLWRRARGERVFVSRHSQFGSEYPAFQMYGVRSTAYFSDASLQVYPDKVVFLADAADASKVIRFAKQHRGGLDITGLNEDSYIVHVAFDGSDSYVARAVPAATAGLISGAYAVEAAQGRTFRWTGQTVRLSVVRLSAGADDVCLTLGLINPWADRAAAVTLTTSEGSRTVAVPFDATFVQPFMTRACTQVRDGTAIVELKSVQPARRFPNSVDTREISFGLLWPVEIE